jgi:hypothetical protein
VRILCRQRSELKFGQTNNQAIEFVTDVNLAGQSGMTGAFRIQIQHGLFELTGLAHASDPRRINKYMTSAA